PEAWVKAQGLLEVRSEISDKNLYLTRPDMGRRHHSRSKDTVLKEVPEAWVKAQGLLEVRSEISDKNLYLTRPDMGRR
ncbi:hypothetical protein CKQ90_34785, partial [Klebsiella pneumoniae]